MISLLLLPFSNWRINKYRNLSILLSARLEWQSMDLVTQVTGGLHDAAGLLFTPAPGQGGNGRMRLSRRDETRRLSNEPCYSANMIKC